LPPSSPNDAYRPIPNSKRDKALVVSIEEQELHWFSFKPKKLIAPDKAGIYRSRFFPGLWIDGPALLARDSNRLLKVVEQGLASTEHAAFVERLQAVRRRG